MAVAYLQEQPSPSIMCYREAHSVPCRGDFIDVFPCSNDRVGIVITDVCGRDAEAHGHARYLRHAVRALADDYSPADLLGRVNRVFARRVADFGGERFATLFVAITTKRRLTYASAGHDFAMLMNADGRHRHLPPTGVIVGICETEAHQERAVRVTNNDWLILVTDGVTDARNPAGSFFGTSGVVRSSVAAIRGGSDDPAIKVLEAARRHGGRQFTDDASVLCVRFS
jgi:serine phosphatase RsbU (regulator of sigma subunit)